MKKSIKVVSIILAILTIVLVSIPVFASSASSDYRPSIVNYNTENVEKIEGVGSRILGIVRVVGTIVAVAMLIVLGIKYMMGSAEERAEYKKTLFPYFIGAILIFAATNLADMIYSWAAGI